MVEVDPKPNSTYINYNADMLKFTMYIVYY